MTNSNNNYLSNKLLHTDLFGKNDKNLKLPLINAYK